MLTDKEIAEIEDKIKSDFTHWSEVSIISNQLLATVKEQRELLRKCRHRIMHTNECETNEDELTCVCDACEIENQIEEAGK